MTSQRHPCAVGSARQYRRHKSAVGSEYASCDITPRPIQEPGISWKYLWRDRPCRRQGSPFITPLHSIFPILTALIGPVNVKFEFVPVIDDRWRRPNARLTADDRRPRDVLKTPPSPRSENTTLKSVPRSKELVLSSRSCSARNHRFSRASPALAASLSARRPQHTNLAGTSPTPTQVSVHRGR